jgi:hypothetical protein
LTEIKDKLNKTTPFNTDGMFNRLPDESGQAVTVFALLLLPRQLCNGICTRTPAFAKATAFKESYVG